MGRKSLEQLRDPFIRTKRPDIGQDPMSGLARELPDEPGNRVLRRTP